MTASLASCVHHSEDCRHLQSRSLKTSRTNNDSPGQGKVLHGRDGLLRTLNRHSFHTPPVEVELVVIDMH